MEQIQKATLTLRTGTFTQPSEGTIEHYNTRITWNNINFRLLMGAMYDKYDNFNLQLVSIASDDNREGELLAGNSNSDRIVSINMSGLNFVNQTYDVKTGNMSSSVTIATYQLYDEFAKNYSNNIVTFTKGNEMCNLTLEYLKVLNNERPNCSASYDFPQMSFLFNVYGIPKDKNPYF